MTDQEARDYVEGAFQALKSRGWFQKTGLVPTGVTDREIADFEAETGRKVPALLKAFLKSYRMDFEFWGIIHEIDFAKPTRKNRRKFVSRNLIKK